MQDKPLPLTADFLESLQLQILTLAVKCLIATHQDPAALRRAMMDLFAQLQSSAEVLALPQPHRDRVREICDAMLQEVR